MATIVLQVVGAVIGQAVGGPVGAAIGATLGSYAGSQIDAELFRTTVYGPKLANLQIQASTEGAPIQELGAGKGRIAGQVIWGTNFKQVPHKESGGKGVGGPPDQVTYSYLANIAIGLLDTRDSGPIDRLGRIWADDNPFDQTGVTIRFYRGTPDQEPDPFIEGMEGLGFASAFRDLCYVFIEGLNITPFGNRIPQFNFELFKANTGEDSLEAKALAVSLIPAAGEFVYDTEIELQDIGGGITTPVNQNSGEERADVLVALDGMQAALPALRTVVLAVAWFGDDLRCGSCTVRPKVDAATKNTAPVSWAVHTLDRSTALLVSTSDGRPAYGGTPTDDSVVKLALELRSRGIAVLLHPFLMMDIPAGNTLPNPYSNNAAGVGQDAYPWRGRITCSPAPGYTGTVDKASGSATQVGNFFGTVAASDITVSIDGDNAVSVGYSGPNEWSWRRFVLHYAKLAAAINAAHAATITGFLIGSELKGLTLVRSLSGTFAAVEKLIDLAADVDGILGSGVKIGYAANWDEYNNYAPVDGTGDVYFHLDPLWSNSHIDFVGIDMYAPLSDWREGMVHADAIAGATSIYDIAYLQSNIEGGEFFTWYYASPADRDAQTRTAITDGAYQKPWVFRAKDLRSWWSNTHKNRPLGVESGSTTSWVAQGKPIWLIELGVPSIDKGTNQPNVFVDPKSSESAAPYYSRGSRDDTIQRRGIEAVLSYWTGATNPTSSVYAAPMIGFIGLYSWDARPYPAFPAKTDLWGDWLCWPTSHALAGKIGLGELAALIASRCARVGFTQFDTSLLSGTVMGYLRDRPMPPRAEIDTLSQVFAFDECESDGVIKFVPRGRPSVATFTRDNCALPEQSNEAFKFNRDQETDLPDIVGFTAIDGNKDYQPISIERSRIAGYSEHREDATVPLVLDEAQLGAIGDRILTEKWIAREKGAFSVPPSRLALDPTDVIKFDFGSGDVRDYQSTRTRNAGAIELQVTRVEGAIYELPQPGSGVTTLTTPPVYGQGLVEIIDGPVLKDGDKPYAPYVAAAAQPFGGVAVLDSATGDSYELDTHVRSCATMGETLTDFALGPTAYFDTKNVLRVKLYRGTLSSADEDTILANSTANLFMLKNADDDWEVCQFCTATLVSTGVYDLSKLLRGVNGTEHAMSDPLPAGARFVLYDAAIQQLDVQVEERGIERFYKHGPAGRDTTHPSWQSTSFTARCIGLKPLSPVNLEQARNAGGDLTVTWDSRTRTNGVWADDSDVPLNEQAELYQFVVKDGADEVRVIESDTPEVVYTAADQTADFGSPQSSVTAEVYQISAVVGRGWPATETL